MIVGVTERTEVGVALIYIYFFNRLVECKILIAVGGNNGDVVNAQL